MSKYRSKEDIIADILKVARENPKKTHIMYRANLSHSLLCRYLDMLIEAGLIDRRYDDFYILTTKGSDYLKRYMEYKNLEATLKVYNDKKIELIKMLDLGASLSARAT